MIENIGGEFAGEPSSAFNAAYDAQAQGWKVALRLHRVVRTRREAGFLVMDAVLSIAQQKRLVRVSRVTPGTLHFQIEGMEERPQAADLVLYAVPGDASPTEVVEPTDGQARMREPSLQMQVIRAKPKGGVLTLRFRQRE